MKEYQERGRSFVVTTVAQKKVILDLNIYKSHVSNTCTKAEFHHTESLATKGIFYGREL